MRAPAPRLLWALAWATLAACAGADPAPRLGPGAAHRLQPAEPVHAYSLRFGYRFPGRYDPEAYSLGDDGHGRYLNILRLQNGRVLAVRVTGRPTVCNEVAGDDLWIWDVTHRGSQPGGVVPVPSTLPTQTLRLGGPKGARFRLRWYRKNTERRVRIEGGGSYLDFPLSRLLQARTRDAAAYGLRTPLPGLVRYQSGRFIEYFQEKELRRAAAAGRVAHPRYVVAPYDAHGRPILREHRLGSTGWVLVWKHTTLGRDRFHEVRAGSVATPDLSPEALYKTRRLAAVAIEVQTGLLVRNGSGALISTDGAVLTNRHVVPASAGDRCTVILWNGRRVAGRVVARDRTRDLALVRIPGHAGRYTPMTLFDRLPPVGSTVLFLGSPTGGSHLSLGRGMVSAISPAPAGPLIQIQAPVNPGHSGGPLLDVKGRQIGVIVSRLTRTPSGRLVQNQSYAIPTRAALAFLRDVSRRQRRAAKTP